MVNALNHGKTINQIASNLLKKILTEKPYLLLSVEVLLVTLQDFWASIYQRGIAYLQYPTTLLAQVDSSVGGKTGINHQLGKNMIGTFYQPSAVFISISSLKKLPKREFFSGLSEVIKYALIMDELFLKYLLNNKSLIFNYENLTLKQLYLSVANINLE